MSNLLQVNRTKSEALKKKGNMGLFMEFPAHPDVAPYLVSSTKAVLWVEETHPGDTPHVKAAIRDIKTPGDFFWEMVAAIIQRGRRDEWGNIHPFTQKGVRAAIDHVEFYEQGDLELLVPRTRKTVKAQRAKKATKDKEAVKAVKAVKGYERPKWLTTTVFEIPVRPSSWVPDDCAVVVPKDRAFVGVMLHLNPKTICAAIHNPSRGVAVAVGKG